MRFLDPRKYDVNHVVGARGLKATQNASSWCLEAISPLIRMSYQVFSSKSRCETAPLGGFTWQALEAKDPAMLYHFAGRSKEWQEMLELFGLPKEATADCRQVLSYVENRSRREVCVPGGPQVEVCEPPEVVC